METFDHYRNKHLLGELTVSDLMEFCKIEGEFTIGKNWLPIVRARVSKRHRALEISMDSVENDPDLELPLDSRVFLEGDIVRIRVSWVGYPENHEVRLRLDRVPDWL
jgi:hypothetical protein